MTKKKTTVEELKELIEATPKLYTFNKEDLQILKDIAHDVYDIRSTLEGLEGAEDISTIMFKVGSMYNVASRTESAIDNFLEKYEEDCDECGDNY